MAAPAEVRVPVPDIVAQTVRLTLRWPQAEDARYWLAYLNDFDVSKMLARVAFPYTQADCDEWLAFCAAERASGEAVVCTVLADMFLGAVGVHGIANGEAELGYWIAKPYWGRGFAREAARAMTDYAFVWARIRRDPLWSFRRKSALGRILSGLGFQETGRGPQSCRARNTDVQHVNMRLTRQRWEAMQ